MGKSNIKQRQNHIAWLSKQILNRINMFKKREGWEEKKKTNCEK